VSSRRANFPKAPLSAAFFCSLALLAGCQSAATLHELPVAACEDPVTPVAAVQGEGEVSPLSGQAVTIRGVVTLTLAGQGLFLQERLSDLSPTTSDGLYVASGDLAGILAAGDQVVVSGAVTEIGEDQDTLTALRPVTGYRVCERNIPLPISDARLPLSSAEREALEGMNILMQQSLAVTDVYGLRDGQLRLSMNGILPEPTEVARPGEDARRQAQENRRSSMDVALLPGDPRPYAVGATVMAATGVLGHDGRGLRLTLREPLASMPKPVYRTDPPAGDDVRVLGLNLHNFFNGDGAGGGFPSPRGAASAAEFEQQRARLKALVGHAQPHLLGVMELENDGFGPRSAASDFVADLRNTGGDWSVINPTNQPIGGDAITVGIFYRADLLDPEGAAMLLTAPPFERGSRVPLAQWFVHRATGDVFLVVVNHLKSKGGCPTDGPNADRRDGQGCWNPARLEAARHMTGWVKRLMEEAGRDKVLILGDLNAYRMEDPVRAVIEAGFRDLTASSGLSFEYSYVYRGEAGTLDYAFASSSLAPLVRNARYLNVNAAYPPGMALEYSWLRSSDHDPVLVDLRFRQPATAD
jgi:predicted extracellular nuclease